MDFHPFFTHFPLAALVFAALGELYQLSKKRSMELDRAILSVLSIGAVGALGSFVTGLSAAESTDMTFKIPDEAIAAHYAMARIALVAVPVVALFKSVWLVAREGRAIFGALYLLSFAAALFVIVQTNRLGGVLVFEHGAGVSATLPSPTESARELPRRVDQPQ